MSQASVGMAARVYPPWRSTFYPLGLRQADERFRAQAEDAGGGVVLGDTARRAGPLAAQQLAV
ncbi:MAG: hypothetical protein WBL06_14345 [Pseudolysinimonas sp.]|uniref:hypothetical protein n=1 Tax=Pseudolysinimonas sp. TaxID=2680009 RepID=UPI003C7688AD